MQLQRPLVSRRRRRCTEAGGGGGGGGGGSGRVPPSTRGSTGARWALEDGSGTRKELPQSQNHSGIKVKVHLVVVVFFSLFLLTEQLMRRRHQDDNI